MEIQKLTIENFQSHKHSELEPAPAGQLTVIVGPSDSGKTAIIRALKWLLYNRPQGAEFIRVGASMAKVSLTITDHRTVTRHRSSTTNRYLISHGDSSKTPPLTLEGFGNDVPLEIKEITGVRPVLIGDMPLALNLAEQLDGPFLGSSISDPVRARVLGKLAGTEEVDYANKQLGTDLYRRGQDLKRVQENVQRLTDQMDQFANLPRLRKAVNELAMLIDDICAGMNRSRQLKSLAAELRDREADADRWRAEQIRLARVDEAEAACKQIYEDSSHRKRLDDIGELLRLADGECKRLTRQLEALEELVALNGLCHGAAQGYERRDKLNYIYILWRRAKERKHKDKETKDLLTQVISEAETNITALIDLVERHNRLFGHWVTYYVSKDMLEIKSAEIRRSESFITNLTKDYQDTLLAAGRCPTCGNEINPEKIKEVV